MKNEKEFTLDRKFVNVLGSKMHYVEAGEGNTFLFLHGNPTSFFLWRNIIPLVAHYGRTIAPDLIGFGKSDKPKMGYRFLDHYRYLETFIQEMNLKDMVLVGHDWGGVLGFYYAMNHLENVKGISFFETFPFTFSWDYFPLRYKIAFRLFRTPLVGQFLIMVLNVFINQMLPGAVVKKLPKEVLEEYQKPFQTIQSRYPIYVWPNELPIEGRENETFRVIKKLELFLPKFDIPMLLLTASPGGVIRKEKIEWLRKKIKNLTIKDVGNGIHFLQEDNPEGIT